MASPHVSVIMGVKNAQEFLNTAVDSLILQTYKNFELIIVDYGSTDQTGSIAKHYSDQRIHYITDKHTTLEEALNYAVQSAKGELIARMDQADHSHPERLSKQVSYLAEHPAVGLIASNFEYIDEDGSFIDRGIEQNANEDLNPALFLKVPLSHGSVMVRKDLFVSEGGYKANEAMDSYDFWIRIGKSSLVACLPDNLYSVRLSSRKQSVGYKPTKKTASINTSYNLWLRIAGSYPEGTFLSNEANASAQGLISILDASIKFAQNIWANKGLTNTQRWLLEEEIFKLNTQWTNLKNSTDTSPLVSVVMSVYNAEKYISAAVDSILGQTFNNFEFIIIDDGSTDNSTAILKSFNDSRIRIISQANHGLVYSLNKGVALAQSELIARMDADDISMPSRLEKQVALMFLNKKLGLTGGFFAYIEELTNRPTSDVIAYPRKHLDLRRSLYINNPFAHGCTMYRREAFDQAGGYNDTYGPTEDYDLWRRIADMEWELELIPEILYLYRLNHAGISSSNSETQHHYAKKIRLEQWQKPFVYEGYRTILRNARYYKDFDGQFSNQVYKQYVNQQYLLTVGMLQRNWLKRGIINSWATWSLDRSKSLPLLRLTAGATLRRLHLKKQIIDLA